MKSSYIFLANHEFSTQHVLKLQGFGSYFTQSFVYGKDLVFDGECTEVLFSKHGKWQNHNFNKSGVNLIKKIAFGDPSIQKHIALSIINNPELEAQLLKAKDNKKIYSLLGEEFLDFRFEKIISSLFATTLDTLIAGVSKEDTSNFAVKLGLVHEDGTYINPLFEEFITRHKKTVTQRPSGPSSTEQTETRETTSRAELLTKLTAKELAIFETLENASPQVVSRDNLAEVLWGKDWLDNYSDWALNKQVSNLRQKIKQVGYAKEIKVLKTEGFMLR